MLANEVQFKTAKSYNILFARNLLIEEDEKSVVRRMGANKPH